MRISHQFRNLIVSELQFAVKNMRETNHPAQKLYFYSAAYGVVTRVFNIEFDPILVHIFYILEATYNTINFMTQRVLKGEEQSIVLPNEFFDHLADAVEELSIKIAKHEEVEQTLQKITNIAYTATGNGHYLYRKGLLKLDLKSPKRKKV